MLKLSLKVSSFLLVLTILGANAVSFAVPRKGSGFKAKSTHIAQNSVGNKSSGADSQKVIDTNSPASADAPAKLNLQQALSVINSSGLLSLSRKADVPKEVASEIPGFDGMAEPGGEFSAGCTGTGPHTRMIFAAKDGNTTVIGHESGGIVHWCKVEIFRTKGARVAKVFSAFVNPGFNDLASLRDLAKKGAIRTAG